MMMNITQFQYDKLIELITNHGQSMKYAVAHRYARKYDQPEAALYFQDSVKFTEKADELAAILGINPNDYRTKG